jgi:hypothetical protein
MTPPKEVELQDIVDAIHQVGANTAARLEQLEASVDELQAKIDGKALGPAPALPGHAELVECAKHGWRDSGGVPCPECEAAKPKAKGRG